MVVPNAWPATAVGLSIEQKTRGDQSQNYYAASQGMMLELAMEQLAGNVGVFVQH